MRKKHYFTHINKFFQLTLSHLLNNTFRLDYMWPTTWGHAYYMRPYLLFMLTCTRHALCICVTKKCCALWAVDSLRANSLRLVKVLIYRRLWLFSAPRQLGAYYYISAYIITVTRPGLLSACALNRMLQLEHVWDLEKWRSEHETECCHCYGPSNVRRLCCPREPNKKKTRHMSNDRSIGFEQSHSISIMRVSCFLSNLYNFFCSWSP